jgi:hypothetical protein
LRNSKIPLLRSSIILPDTKERAYFLFKNANNALWPPGNAGPVPGDYSLLWVQATATRVSRKKKRNRRGFEEEGADGMAGALMSYE